MKSLHPLLQLARYRWSIPVLATLHRAGGGARYAVLANRLDVSRDSLSRSLTSLIESDLVMRNPGYGHPLRPEYMLADRGRAIAPPCAHLLDLLQRLHVEHVALRRWPLPVTAAIAAGSKRFTDIRAAIPSVTPRALSLALQRMQQDAFIDRVVWDDAPPLVEYRLAQRGTKLAPALRSLTESAG